jgi:cytochrome c oxidase subunit 2
MGAEMGVVDVMSKVSWWKILPLVVLGGTLPAVAACGSSSSPSTPSSATGLSGQAALGRSLYGSLGCSACHSTDGSSGTGPTWKGLYGSQVTLTDGQTVTADETYLYDSIEDPNKQIVAGFKPDVMTTVIKPGSVSGSDAQALIAYIKTLK